ncbi:hypothetical protein MrNuV_ORF060 [Macrobrachium rosenbergii nudivirus]|nr:hypothetical protein MrNuV_ORF060 [Macrobrachium rosenbergii nudivirus]
MLNLTCFSILFVKTIDSEDESLLVLLDSQSELSLSESLESSVDNVIIICLSVIFKYYTFLSYIFKIMTSRRFIYMNVRNFTFSIVLYFWSYNASTMSSFYFFISTFLFIFNCCIFYLTVNF